MGETLHPQRPYPSFLRVRYLDRNTPSHKIFPFQGCEVLGKYSIPQDLKTRKDARSWGKHSIPKDPSYLRVATFPSQRERATGSPRFKARAAPPSGGPQGARTMFRIARPPQVEGRKAPGRCSGLRDPPKWRAPKRQDDVQEDAIKARCLERDHSTLQDIPLKRCEVFGETLHPTRLKDA